MRTYALLLILLTHSIAAAEAPLYAPNPVDFTPGGTHLLHAAAPVTDAFLLPSGTLLFKLQGSTQLFTIAVPPDNRWDLAKAEALPVSVPADAAVALGADSLSGAPLLQIFVDGKQVAIVTLSPPRYIELSSVSGASPLLADLDRDSVPDRIAFDPRTSSVQQHLATGRSKPWLGLPAHFHPSILAALHLNADRDPDLLAVDSRNRWCIALSGINGELSSCELKNGYKGPKEIPIDWAFPTPIQRVDAAPGLIAFDPANNQWALATPSLRPIDQFRWLGAAPVGMDVSHIARGDFDGDGQGDLVVADGEARYPFLLQAGSDAIEHELRGATLPNWKDSTLSAADINGDTLADLLIFSPKAQSVWVATATQLPARSDPSASDLTAVACVGFNPGHNQRWGRISRERCPSGFAIMEADDVSGKKDFSASNLGTLCCPLAIPDLLTDEITSAGGRCAADSVAVGSDFDGASFVLSCARINPRYRLSEDRPARYWGLGFSRPVFGSGFISKQEIPAAIRYGAGRRTRRSWDPDGCVGTPIGALLVGRTGTGCRGLIFKEVLDAATGKPVPLLPKCRTVEDIFSEAPHCIQ